MSSKTIVFEIDGNFICGGFSGEHYARFTIQSQLLKASSEICVLTDFFRAIYSDILFVRPKDFGVLIIESPYIEKEFRDHLYEIFSRNLQVESVSFQVNVQLAAVSSGLQSGMVIYVGQKDVIAMPFVDERPLMFAMKCLQFDNDAAFADNISSNKMKSNVSPPISSMSLEDMFSIAEALLDSLKLCSVDSRVAVARGIIFIGRGLIRGEHGFSHEICRIASELTRGTVEYSSLRSVVNKISTDGMELQPVTSVFTSPLAVWIGGSLWASRQSNQCKFITAPKITSCENSDKNGAATQLTTISDWMYNKEIKFV